MTALDQGTTWCRDVENISKEAAGAVEIVVVMEREFPDLVANTLKGDPDSTKLMHLVAQIISRIESASKREPMLCLSCPQPIRQGVEFGLAFAIPSRDDPKGAISMAICGKCGADPAGVMAKAVDGLRKLWPSLRTANITHPEGGRA